MHYELFILRSRNQFDSWTFCRVIQIEVSQNYSKSPSEIITVDTYWKPPCIQRLVALLDWGDSSSRYVSSTVESTITREEHWNSSVQSKGGDPIKDETIQSSVESLTHLP